MSAKARSLTKLGSAKARNLKKLLRSTTTTTTTTTYSDLKAINLTPSAISRTTSAVQDKTLKHYIPFTIAADYTSKRPSELALESLKDDTCASISDSKRELSRHLSDILCGESSDTEEIYDEEPMTEFLQVPWWSIISHKNTSSRRKEMARERKQKWVFKSTQGNHFGKLVSMCTCTLGADATINVFVKLGRETGVKEFNAMIQICIEKARNTDDEDVALEEFHRAYRVFEAMRERGFEIGEVTYGPFLMFIIDMGMVEEFHFFCDHIKKENPESLSRLAYYEMLLWIKVGDEDQIKMLIANTPGSGKSNFNESYLVALCEGDRQEDVSLLLETIDIKRVSSHGDKERIFKSLGRLLLESHAKKFILELKTNDIERQNLSNFIYSYAMSIPKIPIEDIVVKFKDLHAELKVAFSVAPYEKLIRSCCELLEVHLAIDLVDSMFEDGLTVRINTFNTILSACYASYEYNLVHHIYSMINDHSINPNVETFKCMISLCVKMNDFDRAYSMIEDLERLKLIPTANMYNIIMGGYFRQKNFHKGLMVLKQMDASNIKPDSQTFSYIIGTRNCEDDVIKYHRELHESGVQPTKHIFMALINAYTACGLFEKAKQVLSDKGIPVNSLNEIKSALVSALATHGQIAAALDVYDEIKLVDSNLEPKSIICLIEHIQSEGELSRLLQLLKQLQHSERWDEGCARIILYCVRHRLLGSAIDLLKQRMEKLGTNEMATEVLFDEVFCEIAETEPTDVQFGLDLLQAIKEDIGIRASRKSLDFLLSACVKAKDLQRSFSVWKEYQAVDLPYNVLSSVRMYQALLASGAHRAAKILLESIPDDDFHVCCVVRECQRTFGNTAVVKSDRKKKKKPK